MLNKRHQLTNNKNMAFNTVCLIAGGVLLMPSSAALAAGCNVGAVARCDNNSDDTIAIQAVLDKCSRHKQLIVFPAGRTCLTQPLNLSSHTAILFEDAAVLRAGDKVLP